MGCRVTAQKVNKRKKKTKKKQTTKKTHNHKSQWPFCEPQLILQVVSQEAKSTTKDIAWLLGPDAVALLIKLWGVLHGAQNMKDQHCCCFCCCCHNTKFVFATPNCKPHLFLVVLNVLEAQGSAFLTYRVKNGPSLGHLVSGPFYKPAFWISSQFVDAT